MTPIVEAGDHRGDIARCDTCGRTSGWLTSDGDVDDPTYVKVDNLAHWTPSDGFGRWFIVIDVDLTIAAGTQVACPQHAKALQKVTQTLVR